MNERFDQMVSSLSQGLAAYSIAPELKGPNPGDPVMATVMGANPITVEGVFKEKVPSARGDWGIVIPKDGGKEIKTRLGLVKVILH